MINSIEQQIRRILDESTEPLGPSAIAKKMDSERNRIYYHLKKMKTEGIITSSKKGKYSIDKDTMKIIRELKDKILNLLSSEEYYPRELQQELGYDEGKIICAISLLESDGLIKEGQISLAERGGIPRKGPTFHVSDYCRASTYIPTYLGYSKIGFCPICKEKLNSYETVAVSFFRTSYSSIPQAWVSVKIHSKCLPDSKPYEMTYGKFEKSMFCYHCGLPLSPKTLPKHQITYKSVNDHFLGFELESIRLLKGLIQSWIVPWDIPIPGVKFPKKPQNSTIEKVYNELEIRIPDWISERLKRDESDPENDYLKDISWEISDDLNFKFEKDISELKNTENFLRILLKYRADIPNDYDINSRIKEVWTASQGIKKIYEKKIQENYEKLLGFQSSLHFYIDWAFDIENYDFDKVKSEYPYGWSDSPLFSQILCIKCGDNYYHPYCAEKLRLNKDHCNDIK